MLQTLSQLQMAMDTERAICEQTHQRRLLEERCLSHLQEQLDLAAQQDQQALKEVIAFLSSMDLEKLLLSGWFVC